MGKKKEKEPDLEESLIKAYQNWENTRETGCHDPHYDDSVNLNLLRNHILYYKNQMEEKYGEDLGKYPEIYFKELPPEMDRGFMVKAAEIRDKAAESLEIYLSDANFRFLLYNKELLDKKEAERISIENVLGYASGLAAALKEDDLITMRRHAFRPETYQEAFARCAEQVKKILAEKRTEIPKEKVKDGQMTLFQMGLMTGQCR